MKVSTLPEWLRASAATDPAAPRLMRAAFLGRVSTDEQQDPTLSIPRQFANCERALPSEVQIVLHFYDIETSRKELLQRGSSTAWTKFDIPLRRDGGIDDMLAESVAADRRFDIVICESIDRIARFTYQGTKIEHDLELAGVPLLAADEPITLDDQPGRRRKRASQILLRRTKQGVAEWYIVEMLEKSWDGFREHTVQGWNVGKPPYGYIADKHKHPVPAKRAEGKHKHKLAIDPTRAAAVQQIFAWRVDERLSYRAIAERLNQDLDRYPPPQPVDPERAVGHWTYSSVREILYNPKYTGHMTWNRRSTKDKVHPGKNNAREEWVVSAEQTHPALISIETFVASMNISPSRQRSRSDAAPGARNRHPQTKQVYRLRSYVHCEMCGRRMHGKTNHSNLCYYYCRPRDREAPEGHPPSIWLPERDLLLSANEFFNIRIFGADRADLVERSIDLAGMKATEDHRHRTDAVERAVADINAKLSRLNTILEERDDPDGSVFAHVQDRSTELRRQVAQRHAELEHLRAAIPTGLGPVELLEYLPEQTIDLTALPVDRLRRFLDAFATEIHYDARTHRATYRVKISADALPNLARVSAAEPFAPTPPPAGRRPIPRVSVAEDAGTGMPGSSDGVPAQLCDVPRRGHPHDDIEMAA